jgi:hypothetical protein
MHRRAVTGCAFGASQELCHVSAKNRIIVRKQKIIASGSRKTWSSASGKPRSSRTEKRVRDRLHD